MKVTRPSNASFGNARNITLAVEPTRTWPISCSGTSAITQMLARSASIIISSPARIIMPSTAFLFITTPDTGEGQSNEITGSRVRRSSSITACGSCRF